MIERRRTADYKENDKCLINDIYSDGPIVDFFDENKDDWQDYANCVRQGRRAYYIHSYEGALHISRSS